MEKNDSTGREYQLMAVKLLSEIDKILTENGIWYSLAYGSALGAIREKGFIEWDVDVDIMIRKPDQDKVCALLEENLPEVYYVESCKRDTVSSYDAVMIKGVHSGGMHVDIYPLVAGPDNEEKGYSFQLRCRRVHKLCSCKYLELSRLTKKWKIPIVCLIRSIEYLVPNRFIRWYIEKLSNCYDFSKAIYFFPFSNDGKRGEYMEGEILFNTKRVKFENLLLPVPAESDKYLSRLYGPDYMVPRKY